MPPSEAERQDTRKAMLYGLQKIIQKEDGLLDEIRQLHGSEKINTRPGAVLTA